jgi:hypothetical protein
LAEGDGLELLESGPMFGQLAEFPPWWYPGPGAGVVVDPDDEDEPLLEELLPSLCAHAAAPLPMIRPANAAPAIACLSRRVMSFTSSRVCRSPQHDGSTWEHPVPQRTKHWQL